MVNSFVMTTEASYTLNFLIYIQNVYLNQNQSNEEFRYPYFSSKIDFDKNFELRYKELWDEILERIPKSVSNDMKIFHEEKELFYLRLFEANTANLKMYDEIYKSFLVWWDSFAGRFSVERSIDEIGQKLYVELTEFLTQSGIEPQKSLYVSLVYDECLLANVEVSSYFAVLPIEDFFVKYKELVPKLQKCFY